MKNLLVVNVVGLTPELLAHTPRIAAVAQGGFQATLTPPLPAVTTTSQSTMLTGRMPKDHGAVANGWYFRDLAEVWLWRQSNHLVQGPKVWDAARARFGEGVTVAKMFWWYNMYADVNWSVTPRPVYPADGRKLPSIYAEPPSLKPQLQSALGTFPLFNFWGPTADIKSSAWIAKATQQVIVDHAPSLALCYLPHLDYELQRKGPRGPHAEVAAAEIDEVAGNLIDDARGRGYEILVVSEYGIESVDAGVHINRVLRDAGLLRANLVDTGWELLDFGASAAFAVADHQIAHVYVKNPKNISKVKALLEEVDGIERVLDAEGKAACGLDHARSGELVAIAEPGRWFTYYYWLDDAVRPDFANCVDIHRKPGYDPVELFVDPKLAAPKVKVAWTLLKKMAGFRYYMDVIPLDDTLVKGSHGRLPSTRAQGPLVLSSQTVGAADHLPMTAIHDLILDSMS